MLLVHFYVKLKGVCSLELDIKIPVMRIGPHKMRPSENSLSLAGGESDEVQKHTDGNDVGDAGTDSPAS